MYPIDWGQSKPKVDAESDPWRDVVVEALPVDDERVDALVEELRSAHSPHGGVEIACFRLGEHSALNWFGARRRLQLTNFFELFLVRPEVKAAMPTLNITNPLRKTPNILLGTPFTLDGVLASHLFPLGLGEFGGTPHEAKLLAGDFCSALWGERLGEIDLYKTYTAWTDWFWGNGWDCTWFVLDKRYRHLWVLCVTGSEVNGVRNRWKEPPVTNPFKIAAE